MSIRNSAILSSPLFANDEKRLNGKYAVYYVFADRESALLLTIKTLVAPDKMEIQSITDHVPAAALYEREIKDLFGIVPVGHPNDKRLVFHSNWPEGAYPLQKEFDIKSTGRNSQKKRWNLQKVEGRGRLSRFPVGPVHAGIIEPGTLPVQRRGGAHHQSGGRSSTFVHKGIEKAVRGAGALSGACTYRSGYREMRLFQTRLTYCQAIEKIAGVLTFRRAPASTSASFSPSLKGLQATSGDLAGVCLDAAYGFATFQFRMLRGLGVRGRRRAVRHAVFAQRQPAWAGCGRTLYRGQGIQGLIEQLNAIKSGPSWRTPFSIVRANSLFTDRVENTSESFKAGHRAPTSTPSDRAGAPRGCGSTCRKAFPYEMYGLLEFNIPEHYNGDINCRINTKIEECFESIKLMIRAHRRLMPDGKDSPSRSFPLEPCRSAFGLDGGAKRAKTSTG